MLPSSFHRIRHYGFFASPGRAGAILRLRDLIAACDGTPQPSRDVGAGDKATDPEPGCGKQTSVTAGTIMHHSKLPLTTWFWAAVSDPGM